MDPFGPPFFTSPFRTRYTSLHEEPSFLRRRCSSTVERRFCKAKVAGSIPVIGSITAPIFATATGASPSRNRPHSNRPTSSAARSPMTRATADAG